MTTRQARQGLGIGLIVLSCLSFSILDSGVKHAMTLAPAAMLLWFRYGFQAVITLVLRLPVQGRTLLATEHPRFQVARGLLLLVSTVCAFFSLKYIPVGEFTAMVMLSPLIATGMSAWFLKVHVQRLSWVLLITGLLGVVLVVHPGGSMFTWALVFPAILVCANAGFQVLTSRLSGADDPYTTQFYTGLVGAVAFAPLLWYFWDGAALWAHWPWFLLLGISGAFGHLMLIRAFMHAPAPVLMPYIYTQIGFSMLLGWLVFAHVPDTLAWVGIGVIAVSGVANALLVSHPVTARVTARATDRT
jgi:drug/metabolite transporter (DMT)-like permease